MSRKFVYFGTLLVIAIVGTFFLLFNDVAPPSISLSPDTKSLGKKQSLNLNVTDNYSSIDRVHVSVVQDQQVFTIINRHFTSRENVQHIPFTLGESGLKQGPFELIISATDNSWANLGKGNTATKHFSMELDIQAPRLKVLSPSPSVRRGSATVVAYEASEELDSTGIVLGELFFPAFLNEKGQYVVYFPFPLDFNADNFKPEILAYDFAGNTTRSPLIVHAQNRNYTHDNLGVGDAFLKKVMPPFKDAFPKSLKSDLQRYVYANSVIRKENDKTLAELAKHSAKEKLWTGPMLRLPKAATRAQFGDDRSYVYKGETIDRQTHMGIDLASTAKAEIPAANDGRVVFAGPLGIHGNAIVIDHGQGLMSLYSHTSKMNVAPGDLVKKGDIIGNTGTSGLAGGDHLHFGILASGVQVQPADWFDKKWIENAIEKRLPK